MASRCRPACGTWSLSNRALLALPRYLLALAVLLLPSAAFAPAPCLRTAVCLRPSSAPLFRLSSTQHDPKPAAPSFAIQRFLRSGFRPADPRGTAENLGCTGRAPV